MAADYKPGDMAMVQKRGSDWHPALFTDDGWVCFHNILCGPHDVRPLVAIDPEDETTLRQIGDLLVAADRGYDDESWQDLQAALREFANPTPPKPDEPQGLGAVVEDADGDIWVHDRPANPGYLGVEWLNTRTQAHCRYESIAAVRVLSHGYTEDGA